MLLTRDEILGITDLQIEVVTVPEWHGREVAIRSLSGDHRELVEIRTMQLQDNLNSLCGYRAFVLSLSMCDSEGRLLFTPDDLQQLGEKNAAVLERLTEQVLDMSGLAVEAVETAKKNSETDQNAASGSSLPLPSEAP